ncbi:MAG: hypothetical protein ACXQS8_00790 [Candidatus Helarchaeales archaeon]
MMVEDEKYQMWKELGIDLEKHDQLLSILPTIYKEIYIDTQENRPESMNFWEMVVLDIHGIRPKELHEAKKQGTKIIFSLLIFD